MDDSPPLTLEDGRDRKVQRGKAILERLKARNRTKMEFDRTRKPEVHGLTATSQAKIFEQSLRQSDHNGNRSWICSEIEQICPEIGTRKSRSSCKRGSSPSKRQIRQSNDEHAPISQGQNIPEGVHKNGRELVFSVEFDDISSRALLGDSMDNNATADMSRWGSTVTESEGSIRNFVSPSKYGNFDTKSAHPFAEVEPVSDRCRLHDLRIKRLFNAIRNGDVSTTKSILEIDRNLSLVTCEQNFTKSTALHWGCLKGHVEIVRLLVANCANLSDRDRSGRTPLHCAAAKGHADCTRFLLQSGADTSATDCVGNTAEECAKRRNYADVMREFALHRWIRLLAGDPSNWTLPNMKTVLDLSGYKGKSLTNVIEAERTIRRSFEALDTIWKDNLFYTRLLHNRTLAWWRYQTRNGHIHEQNRMYMEAMRKHSVITFALREWKLRTHESRAWKRGFDASSDIEACNTRRQQVRDIMMLFRIVQRWSICAQKAAKLGKCQAQIYTISTKIRLRCCVKTLAMKVRQSKIELLKLKCAQENATKAIISVSIKQWRTHAIRRLVYKTRVDTMSMRRVNALSKTVEDCFNLWRQMILIRMSRFCLHMEHIISKNASISLNRSILRLWHRMSVNRAFESRMRIKVRLNHLRHSFGVLKCSYFENMFIVKVFKLGKSTLQRNHICMTEKILHHWKSLRRARNLQKLLFHISQRQQSHQILKMTFRLWAFEFKKKHAAITLVGKAISNASKRLLQWSWSHIATHTRYSLARYALATQHAFGASLGSSLSRNRNRLRHLRATFSAIHSYFVLIKLQKVFTRRVKTRRCRHTLETTFCTLLYCLWLGRCCRKLMLKLQRARFTDFLTAVASQKRNRQQKLIWSSKISQHRTRRRVLYFHKFYEQSQISSYEHLVTLAASKCRDEWNEENFSPATHSRIKKNLQERLFHVPAAHKNLPAASAENVLIGLELNGDADFSRACYDVADNSSIQPLDSSLASNLSRIAANAIDEEFDEVVKRTEWTIDQFELLFCPKGAAAPLNTYTSDFRACETSLGGETCKPDLTPPECVHAEGLEPFLATDTASENAVQDQEEEETDAARHRRADQPAHPGDQRESADKTDLIHRPATGDSADRGHSICGLTSDGNGLHEPLAFGKVSEAEKRGSPTDTSQGPPNDVAKADTHAARDGMHSEGNGADSPRRGSGDRDGKAVDGAVGENKGEGSEKGMDAPNAVAQEGAAAPKSTRKKKKSKGGRG